MNTGEHDTANRTNDTGEINNQAFRIEIYCLVQMLYELIDSGDGFSEYFERNFPETTKFMEKSK